MLLIRCNRCGESKDESHFYKRKDGRTQSMCKECRSAYRKEKMSDPAKHAEQLERQRLWNESHKEYISEYGKEWYAKPENKKRLTARRRVYDKAQWASNPQVRERKNRQKYESLERRKNDPAFIKKRKSWIANANHRRRIRMKQGTTPATRLTQAEWDEIRKKANYRCLCCGKRKPLVQDHVIPISKGGTHSANNIQPLCRKCNNKKFNHTIDYR